MFGQGLNFGGMAGPGGIQVIMKLWGTAGSGTADCSYRGPYGNGGGGGYVNILSQGIFTEGSTFYVYVGQGGVWQRTTTTFGGGGGAGGSLAGSGGGASYVSIDAPASINSLVAVAGSGGARSQGAEYTDGGGLVGKSGNVGNGALGGSQVAGGAAGTGGYGGGGGGATAGSFLQGGKGPACKGPGGGSGYYGGGGGYGDCGSCGGAGAAGGSSYINSTFFQTINNNDQGNAGAASTAAQSDPDWNGTAAMGVAGATNQPNGQIVIYIDGVKHDFGYTGAVQTLTI